MKQISLRSSGLLRFSVISTPEAEEPIAALLETVFAASPSTWANQETKESVITVYLRSCSAILRPARDRIRRGLEELRELGLNIGSGAIHVERVRREDWSESWKKYFKTIEIGSSLLIKPSWSKQKAKPGQAVVVLDPGLSFGTGQHATTSFCLREIASVARTSRGNPGAMLDIGSGSGILAIAAAKLGYSPVEAFDFDPVAVRVAEKNCRSNRVQRLILSRKDLTRIAVRGKTRYPVICANLISTLLIQERARILNRLAPGGRLILAGILTTEFETVRRAYEAEGLSLVRTKIEGEWQSGSFRLLCPG